MDLDIVRKVSLGFLGDMTYHGANVVIPMGWRDNLLGFEKIINLSIVIWRHRVSDWSNCA